MRSGKPLRIFGAVLLATVVAVGAQMEPWVQQIPTGPLFRVFFRSVPMPGGDVDVRRLPAETRPALAERMAATPRVASLYRWRAREDERALDFPAAEADWRKYAQRTSPCAEGWTALADYFHRREQPSGEIEALTATEKCKTNPITPLAEQLPWKAVERSQSVASEEALPDSVPAQAFATWIDLHPTDANGYRTALGFLVSHKLFHQAQTTLAAYRKQFPEDRTFAVQQEAELAAARGSVEQAIAFYDAAVDPLAPTSLTDAYFALLQKEGRLRDFLATERTNVRNEATNLRAAARIFAYFQNQKNGNEAKRALLDYKVAKESARQPYTAEELWTLGQLFERVSEKNEAAKDYYAAWSAAGPRDVSGEKALAALANLLLREGDQPIAFGSGDLSFYRNIGTADDAPGFLNGILSLLFNSSSPAREYDRKNPQGAAYFRRSTGERLVNLLQQRFPQATELASLRAAIVQDCALYADDQCTIRTGRAYLQAFPTGTDRVATAMLLANALARQKQATEELTLYDDLLKELAEKAQGVPLGRASAETEGTNPIVHGSEETEGTNPIVHGSEETEGTKPTARSPEYQQVLDRELARLSELKRPMDALRVYRREIDRNPNDPGLYQQFAGYLETNRLGTQLAETYRRAFAKFPDGGWYQSLARWYLRRKRTADFEKLTREVTAVFGGSELERYFGNVVASAKIDGQMSVALNLYAHQRFPEDLVFVRRLVGLYRSQGTEDEAARAELLRRYWYGDEELKREFFGSLAASGELAKDLAGLLGTNPAEQEFLAEGHAWLSHFEEAAPQFRAMAETTPGDAGVSLRAASVYRSLSAFDARNTEIAVALQRQAVGFDPRNADWLETVGDIYADRGELGRARPVWNTVPRIEPGKPDSALSAATVFWDYYQFDDALRVLGDARRKFGKPALYAYQAGAIQEGKRDYRAAVAEYVAGALDGETQAQARLVRLAGRKGTAELVESATESLRASDPAERKLRIAMLEAQEQRRGELETFLRGWAGNLATAKEAEELAEVAGKDGFDAVQEQAREREVALTRDPVDRMRLEIDLARFFEGRGNIQRAQSTIEALYRANPRIVGVVRATVDFYGRTHQPDRAIATLTEAAKNARPDLGKGFLAEAARVATAAGQFDRARSLYAGLLKTDPWNAAYLAGEADTYLAAKDDAGYQRFALETIQGLQKAPLPAGEKGDRVAALRRGLIPPLTRQGNFEAAVEQYIEVVNHYPDDEGLAREAAGYASDHGRLPQILNYYRVTIEKAPRDYRWPIVLARMETRAEDFPAAIAAYQRGMEDRPDRADIAQARAALEERTLRFEDALKTYGTLYQLSYHDPQWMTKSAEMDARLGRHPDAVKALRVALIGDFGETPERLFAMADQLDRWGMVREAEGYAEQGAKAEGKPLFATEDASPLLPVYARVLTRAHHLERLLTRMAPDSSAGVEAAAAVIREEYTPAEKAGVDEMFSRLPALPSRVAGETRWEALAEVAKLAPLQARILREQMLGPENDEGVMNHLDQLETRRGAFEVLGKEMEELAGLGRTPKITAAALNDAANAYRAENDLVGGGRAVRQLVQNTVSNGGPALDWYLASLVKSNPEELVELARASTVRDRAAQEAIARGDGELAVRAVAARGKGENPLWNGAYTALAGLYTRDGSAVVRDAFMRILSVGDDIGTRVKTPVDREKRLAGEVWFPYGTAYGEYLAMMKQNGAEAFWPAAVEDWPGDPEAYLRTGDLLAEHGQDGAAMNRFREVLQLDKDLAGAHDRIARVLWKSGKKSEAVAEWKEAIATLQRVEGRGVAVPEWFWVDGPACIRAIGGSGALAQLQADLGRWLADYVRRNGGYRVGDLIGPAVDVTLDAGVSIQWLTEVAQADSTMGVTDVLLRSERLTAPQKVTLERLRVEEFEKQAAAAHGDAQRAGQATVASERLRLIDLLLDARDVAGAEAEWARLDATQRDGNAPTEIRLAAFAGRLPSLLQRLRIAGEQGPSVDVLQSAMGALRRERRAADAWSVAEFLYARELERQHLDAANFLGLAEVHLERGETAAAVALLRRMNLVAGEPFETFVPAADLLRRYGKNAEAIPFLRDRVRAVPWDGKAKEQLGEVAGGAASPAAGAENQPYDVRARVAAAKGAEGSTALRLLREALAIEPENADVRNQLVRAAVRVQQDALALAVAAASEPGGETPADEGTAEDLSVAAERNGEFERAASFETVANNFRKEAGQATDGTRLRALQKEAQREQDNAARQPVVGTEIEQKRAVRPKLLAEAGSAQ